MLFIVSIRIQKQINVTEDSIQNTDPPREIELDLIKTAKTPFH